MRLWQRSMIRLARNDAVRTFMQQNRWSSALAGRFVAGKDLAAARRKIEELRQQGVIASIYYLGEYVTSQDLVEQNVRRIIDVIESTGPAESSAFLSIDPTQIGYSISEETGRSNALRIGHAFVGRKSMRFIMIDMEDSSYVARSIALYHTLRPTCTVPKKTSNDWGGGERPFDSARALS
jgi:proline dehydrogenase